MSKSRRVVAAVTLAIAIAVAGGVTLPASPAAAAVAKGVTTMDKTTLRIVCRLAGGIYLNWSDGTYSCWVMDGGGSIECEADGTCTVYEHVRPSDERPRDYVVDPGDGVPVP
jgi:hypothetical protein